MKIALGTVQFGIDYGITNRQGRTPKEEVEQILKFAKTNGIDLLDTAPSYGQSEAVLGQFHQHYFKIITKTPHFDNEVISKSDLIYLKEQFDLSLKNLNVSNIYGLMIHNVLDCYKTGADEIFLTLQSLKEAGLVEKIGVSVYTPEDIEMLLNNFTFDMIQLPLNVLDQRVIKRGLLKELKNRNVEIYVRSVFLQGLLLEELSKVPEKFQKYLKPYFDDIESYGISKIETALYFLNRMKEIDYVVIGVNNLIQLKRNYEAFQNVQYCKELNIDYSKYAVNEIDVIDPRRW